MKLNIMLHKTDINPTVPLIEWIIYDIITDVWDNPETDYKGVCARTCLRTETVVNVLRWAEKNGYIEGHGGFYSKRGGGAKLWRALKLPAYPYRFLSDYKICYTIVAHVGDWRISRINIIGQADSIDGARQIIKGVKNKKINYGIWPDPQPRGDNPTNLYDYFTNHYDFIILTDKDVPIIYKITKTGQDMIAYLNRAFSASYPSEWQLKDYRIKRHGATFKIDKYTRCSGVWLSRCEKE